MKRKCLDIPIDLHPKLTPVVKKLCEAINKDLSFNDEKKCKLFMDIESIICSHTFDSNVCFNALEKVRIFNGIKTNCKR